jgi:Protein of unknown function (DUF2491)
MGVIAKILEKKSKRAIGHIKDVFSSKPAKEPQKDYPLGLHLNAILRFDPTDFILAGNDLKIEFPTGDIAVSAIGEFRCLGISFYRFYVKDLKDDEWVLQVAGSKEDLDVILYQTIDEVYPDDWDFWLNDETGLIGYKDFNTPDQVEYSRVLRNPGPDYANPIEFQESVRSGEDSLYIDHAMMLYGREISITGDQVLNEFLLVSKEEDEEGAMVRIMAGVPVGPMSLTIL